MAEKKTLFHSELVQMGRVQVTQKNLPQKSKFSGKPDYVALVIDGAERLYNCENDACKAFFNIRGNEGRVMVIEATGSRDDASIDWINDVAPESSQEPSSRPPARQTQQAAPARAAAAPPARTAPPAPAAPPPQAQSAQPEPRQQSAPPKRQGPTKEEQQAKLQEVKVLAAKLANICQISRTAAEHARDMFKAQRDSEITEEQVQSWAASIFIQITRDGHQNGMPAGIIPIGTPPAKIPGEADPGSAGTEQEDDVPM